MTGESHIEANKAGAGGPAVGQGALVTDNGQTLSSSSSGGDGTQIAIDDTPIYDDLGFFDDVNDQFVIPASPTIQRVRVGMQCSWEASASGFRKIRILKNGLSFGDVGGEGMPALETSPRGSVNNEDAMNITSGAVPVSPGDTFTFFAQQNHGANLSITNVSVWIEVVK